MLPLLESQQRIINIDETWLDETRWCRRHWAHKDSPSTIVKKAVNPRLSVIAALDTDGNVWCCLNHSNTDSDVMTAFIQYL